MSKAGAPKTRAAADAPKDLAAYKAEVKRLLVEMGLNDAWATELIEEIDHKFVERMFDENGPAQEAAEEICCTRREADEVFSEAKPTGPTFVVPLPQKAVDYLDDLVRVGLYGETREQVATTLVHQQLRDLMGAGVLKRR